MSDSFLETDDAIHALLEELQKFKSSSEQFSLTDSNVTELLKATEHLSSRSAEVAEQGRKSSEETNSRLVHIIDHQQSLTDSIIQTLKRDILPAVEETQRLGRSNRTTAIVLLILIVANLALSVYIVWTMVGI